MRLFLVTPTFRAGDFLRQTTASVRVALDNCPSAHLVYVIADGGSLDGSVHDALFNHPRCRLHVISERDRGMYDALTKGFRLAEGDWCFYLNAGDLLFPSAFLALDRLSTSHPQVNWVTFRTVGVDEGGIPFGIRTPMPVNFRILKNGGYGKCLPYVQQENSVWRRELLTYVDLELLSNYKLAGDYYLWRSLASAPGVNQATVEALWAGFRVHEGQLSEARGAYRAEVANMVRLAGPFERLFDWFYGVFYGLMYHAPGRLKRMVTKRYIRLV